MKEQLELYVKSNVWANQRIGKVLSKMPSEKLDQAIVSSFPSLRKTVYHIWDAEIIWLNRLQGKSLDHWPHEKLTGEEPIESFVKTSEEFRDFVLAQPAAFTNGSVTFTRTGGASYESPVFGMVMHTMNHSSFHRGQLVTMLRQAGVTEIPGTDLIWYMRENTPA